MRNLPAMICIMDGFGWAEPSEANAISLANTPNLDALLQKYPFTTLGASGKDVGLPDGQMGNSEVGHLNIGAGRVVMQELMRIDHAIETGELFKNEVLCKTMDDVAQSGATLHLMGLVSDGGVHSQQAHGEALIKMAAGRGVQHVSVHAFLDGRDVPPGSAIEYVRGLSAFCANISEQSQNCDAHIATVSGRYYAMDRDKRWERVERAWDAIVLGRGSEVLPAVEGIQKSYDNGVTDEFVIPFVCDTRGVQDGDAVVFFNFRPDRARQLTHAFVDATFDGFDRKRVPEVTFVCMTEYDAVLTVPIAFPKTNPKNVLADVIASAGLKQYHTAETEKYAHVTFFFNGGVEQPKEGEQRCLIASPKVATYDLQPQMSAPEVSETLAQAIENDAADIYIVNFANPDMVGHTGVLEAAVKAIEATDAAMGKVVNAIRQKGGVALVTADHGNADCMFTIEADGSRKPMTAHTLARVPFIVVADGVEIDQDAQGRLCDIAPTLLDLVDITQPQDWTGKSLVKWK